MANHESNAEGMNDAEYADSDVAWPEGHDTRDPYAILLDGLYPGNERDHGPVITAAGFENPAELHSILQRSEMLSLEDRRAAVLDFVYTMGLRGSWNTPLLRAIVMRRETNVRMLLVAGSDPDGVPLDMQRLYSAHLRFIRDWRISTDEAVSPPNHIRPNPVQEGDHTNFLTQPVLSADELVVRARTTSKFLTIPNAAPLDSADRGDTLHSLVAAAAHSTIDIFDILCDAGANVSFWMESRPQAYLPDPPTPSSLCVSTPLHAAAGRKDTDMPSHLLDCGFNPNVLPVTAMCQGLTPAQSALATGKEANVAAFKFLDAHPQTDSSILSPIYGVHVNHFAVARLEPKLLKTVSAYLPPRSTPPTALGHTVLHIACLPLTDLHIQLFAPKVYQSIHDVRTLYPRWQPTVLHTRQPPGSHPMSDKDWPPSPTVTGPTQNEHGILDRAFLGLPREERTRYTVRGKACYMTPHPSGKGPMIYQTYGQRSAAEYEPIPIADEHEGQTAMVKLLIDSLGVETLEEADIYGNTALHYLSGARDINAALIAWLRHFELGKQVWEPHATDGAGRQGICGLMEV